MLSYQHMYHAGCLADVHKHFCLATLLAAAAGKATPVTYIETHAGRGLYTLTCREALKTGEAKRGIVPVLASHKLPSSHPYARCIEDIRKSHSRNHYPGSPYIAAHLLRRSDALHLIELHPTEHAELLRNMRGKHINVQRQDGYAAVRALRFPATHQCILFIDPSYERKEEYEMAARSALEVLAKWPNIIIMLWYPILERGAHQAMCALLSTNTRAQWWQQEVRFPASSVKRALGSGLMVCNLPTHLIPELEKVRPLCER
jgi:23S rRNA (adenine2030-N6)-methyltransferase